MRWADVELPTWDTELPEEQRAGCLAGALERWINSPPLSELPAYWGERAPNTDAASLFRWYSQFSAKYWDFRAGQERDQASQPALSDIQVEAALEGAEALGLRGSRQPLRRSYDVVLVLGGLIRACITRPRFAAELVDQGLRTSSVVALGGFRRLSKEEREIGAALGIDVDDEFGAMLVGLTNAFDVRRGPQVDHSPGAGTGNADWRVATLQGEPNLSVVAAPSREPDARRANTADTLDWWTMRVGGVQERKILVVTSSIYVPYQGAAAIQELGLRRGASVETVGTSQAAANLGDQTQQYAPSNYLQEIRSAILGYAGLYQAVQEVRDGKAETGIGSSERR